MSSRPNANRVALVTVGLVIAGLLLMTFDIRSSTSDFGTTMREGVQTILSPVQTAINAVVDPVVDVADSLADLAGLRQENERLRDRIVDLEREMGQVDHLRSRIDELNTLLGLELGDDLQERAVNAEVTGRGGALDQSFLIDRGTQAGVQEGQPVVDAGGALLGVVAEASEVGATVIPITSRRAPGVTVRLADGRRGVVEGQGTDRLILTLLDASAPVWSGDHLETFGPYGSRDAYPKGLIVGTVRESASPQSGTIQVAVEPLADLEQAQFVAVIPWPPDSDLVEEELGATATAPGPEGGEGESSEESSP